MNEDERPMFERFDFTILDDPGFKEDSVREELVVPILQRLGYSATGEHRIIRTQPLEHPFVHIGTKPHKINIYPDYQLAPAGEKGWVLDAKAPSEEIHTGRNVEQAYSYAIHRDVRVSIYALCNGRELVVYHISELEPKLVVPLSEIHSRWKEVDNLLCPLAFTNPEAIGFLPDFGLSMLKLGHVNLEKMTFPLLPISLVSKARDDLYTAVSSFDIGESYCASFDLSPEIYAQFLDAMTPEHRAKTEIALSQHPWSISFEDDQPEITIGAVYAGYKIQIANETYVPLRIVTVRQHPNMVKKEG